MTKHNTFNFAGEFFKTKKDVITRIQEILHSKESVIHGQDYLFLYDIFMLHPDIDNKIGVGIKQIESRINKEYPKTKCFWIVRNDGTETDISFMKCLTDIKTESLVLKAFRVEISEQIESFKKNFFDSNGNNVYLCPLTNEVVHRWDCHVDHISPKTFLNLVNEFCLKHELTLGEIAVYGSGVDGNILKTLADRNIANLWKDFHSQNAILRVLSKRGNLSCAKVKG
jgi:hypothetical protein